MSDLIDRQAAIDAVNSRKTAEQSSAGIMRNAVVDFCVDIIKKLPSAQPERARGTWMPDTMCYYEERFICSECKGNYKVDTCMGKPMWNFCPNCGADMRQREVTT